MTTWDAKRLEHVTDILMGAAHADGTLRKDERKAVEAIVRELGGDEARKKSVRARIEAFAPEKFDLQWACEALVLGTADERRALLQLVARVTESDNVHDFDESDYIVKVAECLGASPDEYKGLTVEFLESPPPLPPSKPPAGAQ